MTDPTDLSEPTDDAPNEILAAAKEAKAHKEAAARALADRRTMQFGAIGLGVGIGSAAVAAAVLYASRSRAKK